MLHSPVETPCHSARSNLNSMCGLAKIPRPPQLLLPSGSYSGKWINNHIVWCPRLWKLSVTIMFTGLLASGIKLCNPSTGTLVPKSNFVVCMFFSFPPFKFIFASEEKLDSTLTNSQLLPKLSIMSFDVFIVTIPQHVKSLPSAVWLSIFISRRLSCNPPNTSFLGYNVAIWQSAALFDFESLLSNTSQSHLCGTESTGRSGMFHPFKTKREGRGKREKKGKETKFQL